MYRVTNHQIPINFRQTWMFWNPQSLRIPKICMVNVVNISLRFCRFKTNCDNKD